MPSRCENRLTVVGRDLPLFKSSSWEKLLPARHLELLEASSRRFVCQFETDIPPLKPLQRLSCRWPTLVFFLDYEFRRRKGLVQARNGKIESVSFHY
jgi:hypothetical protein